jgi:hypothetical protein
MHSTLGATDPFFDAASTTHHYPFHEIPEEAYMEASATQFHSVEHGSPASATAVRHCHSGYDSYAAPCSSAVQPPLRN